MPQLTPEQLSKEWSSGKLRPVYYLAGEEQLPKSEAVAALKKRLNPDTFNLHESAAEGTKASEIISISSTPPVFAETRLVVIRSVDRLPAAEKKILADYLADPCPSTCLVLLSNAKKSREDPLNSPSEKTGASVIFWPMREYQVPEWISSKIEKTGRHISKEAAHVLAQTLGTDTLLLSSEIEKLLLYTEGCRAPITPEQVLESMGFSKNENPFALSRAIMTRDTSAAVALLDSLLASGEEPLRLLYIISGALTKIIKAKRMLEQGCSPDRIFFETGVNKFYDKDFLSLAGAFGEEAGVIRGMGLCVETEALFKSSSGRDPGLALKQLLAEILPPRPGGKKTVTKRGAAAE